MSNAPYLYEKITKEEYLNKKYNPNYGDGRECKCGHNYERHFDTYEEMSPVGCKYCQCNHFEEAVEKNNECPHDIPGCHEPQNDDLNIGGGEVEWEGGRHVPIEPIENWQDVGFRDLVEKINEIISVVNDLSDSKVTNFIIPSLEVGTSYLEREA